MRRNGEGIRDRARDVQADRKMQGYVNAGTSTVKTVEKRAERRVNRQGKAGRGGEGLGVGGTEGGGSPGRGIFLCCRMLRAHRLVPIGMPSSRSPKEAAAHHSAGPLLAKQRLPNLLPPSSSVVSSHLMQLTLTAKGVCKRSGDWCVPEAVAFFLLQSCLIARLGG